MTPIGCLVPIRSAYLVCTTPRSGSTLLSSGLAGTGLAGRPDEYFQHLLATRAPRRRRDHLAGLSAGDLGVALEALPHDPVLPFDPSRGHAGFARYLEWVVREKARPTASSGPRSCRPTSRRSRPTCAPCSATGRPDPPAACWPRRSPRLRYVWLVRDDKVGRAVSLWRALQTWRWRGGGPAEPPLRHSYAAIDHLRRGLEAEDDWWRRYFAARGSRRWSCATRISSPTAMRRSGRCSSTSGRRSRPIA